MDGSLKISTKKSRETSMSDFEIICRLCNAVNILSSIILEQQNLLEQSDIEKTIKDRFSMKYEDVEKNLDGIIQAATWLLFLMQQGGHNGVVFSNIEDY